MKNSQNKLIIFVSIIVAFSLVCFAYYISFHKKTFTDTNNNVDKVATPSTNNNIDTASSDTDITEINKVSSGLTREDLAKMIQISDTKFKYVNNGDMEKAYSLESKIAQEKMSLSEFKSLKTIQQAFANGYVGQLGPNNLTVKKEAGTNYVYVNLETQAIFSDGKEKTLSVDYIKENGEWKILNMGYVTTVKN